jgi:hypothetical protein
VSGFAFCRIFVASSLSIDIPRFSKVSGLVPSPGRIPHPAGREHFRKGVLPTDRLKAANSPGAKSKAEIRAIYSFKQSSIRPNLGANWSVPRAIGFHTHASSFIRVISPRLSISLPLFESAQNPHDAVFVSVRARCPPLSKIGVSSSIRLGEDFHLINASTRKTSATSA